VGFQTLAAGGANESVGKGVRLQMARPLPEPYGFSKAMI
jgi:hypothetical protein